MFKNFKYPRQQSAQNYKSQLDSLRTEMCIVFFFFLSRQQNFKGLSGIFACTISPNLVWVFFHGLYGGTFSISSGGFTLWQFV